MHWRAWVEKYAPIAASRPMAAYHERIWEWFEGLKPGEKPPALVECVFRGGGKSTTVELALARQAVKLERRFALYVSCNQVAANRHVQSAADTMERVGIQRSVNKYGSSKGWNASMLRTANGFNLLALGLDVAVRGIKLGEFRPDIILLDDIDALGDSIDGVKKKVEVLAQSILIAGSTDLAVAFVQNAIHMHSIMTGVMDGTLDILRRRTIAAPVPAIVGLEWESSENAAGEKIYRITAGEPSWAGKTVQICETEMNDIGIVSFLRECQHDTGVGGRFFADWNEKRHVIFEPDISIEKHWTWCGGFDWGYGAPCCFTLACVDERGRVVVVDEVYERNLTNPEQAQAVVDCISRWGIPLDRVAIRADPSMWSLKTDHAGKKVADVEAFHRAGLRFVKASNERRGGWQNVRRYLKEAIDNVPALRVLKGRCSNLIRTFPIQVFDTTDVEDLDTDGEDHAVDSLRYLLSGRPRAEAQKPPDPNAPPAPGQPDLRMEFQKRKAAPKRKL